MKIFELQGLELKELDWVEAVILNKEEVEEYIPTDPNIISDPDELYGWTY
jgi:hypothetical protein